jgi:hypothetical protein
MSGPARWVTSTATAADCQQKVGHGVTPFGVPASAGRASIAWGAGKVSSAGFSFPTPSAVDPGPPKGGTRALERQRAQEGESPFLAELPARNGK